MRSLSLLCAAAALAAALPCALAQPAGILLTPNLSETCPVNLTVERQSGLQLSPADTSRRGRSAQGIRVHLLGLEDRKILSADIVVHGYSPTQRVVPALTSQGDEVTRTFHLVRNEHAADPLDFTLQVEKIGAVRNVTITSLEYADGPAWHTSEAAHCSAAPNPFLLVGTLR